MIRFFEVMTGVGAMLAALILLVALGSGMSAPQQAAAAAIGLGFVIIPYCVLGMLQRRALLARRQVKTAKGEGLEPLGF